MNIGHLLWRAGTVHRDRPGVALGRSVVWTYGQLLERASRLAAGLGVRFGLARGDRVAIVCRNVPEYLEIMWGAWLGGFTAVPVNAKLHPREIAWILAHSGTRVCFVTADLASGVNGILGETAVEHVVEVGTPAYAALLSAEPTPHAEAAPDDVAWLFYTSGTTGKPKGAMLTHANLLAMTTSYFLDIDFIQPGNAILHPAPMSHGSGCYIPPNVAMAACHVVPESGGFDPAEILDMIGAWPGTSFFAAPTMINRLVGHMEKAGGDVTNLRTIIYGGAPMHVADVRRAIGVMGPRLAQLYGQGESPMCITGLSTRWYADSDHPRWEAIIASAGFPQTVVEVRIEDADGNPLPPGEKGEVCARGAPVMKGYWNQPEATAETLKGGWLHTGDVGHMDAHGFLTLSDRSKDLIISGGTNIYPREIEEVILMHPAVLECAVVGTPHPDWGEEVVAVVVTRPGTTVSPAELDTLITDRLARFKRPKRYQFPDALPKNAYGKIVKRDLREALARG